MNSNKHSTHVARPRPSVVSPACAPCEELITVLQPCSLRPASSIFSGQQTSQPHWGHPRGQIRCGVGRGAETYGMPSAAFRSGVILPLASAPPKSSSEMKPPSAASSKVAQSWHTDGSSDTLPLGSVRNLKEKS
jgi:hypothetical protein